MWISAPALQQKDNGTGRYLPVKTSINSGFRRAWPMVFACSLTWPIFITSARSSTIQKMKVQSDGMIRILPWPGQFQSRLFLKKTRPLRSGATWICPLVRFNAEQKLTPASCTTVDNSRGLKMYLKMRPRACRHYEKFCSPPGRKGVLRRTCTLAVLARNKKPFSRRRRTKAVV